MRFIHNLTVKARLELVLIFLIILSIVMALFSIYQIGSMASLTQEMHDHPLKVSSAATKANLYLAKSRSLIKDILLSKDAMLMARERITVEEYQKIIKDNLEIVRGNIIGDQGINLEKETRKLFSEWIGIWQQEWYLFSKGNANEATKMYANQGKVKTAELEVKMEQLQEHAMIKADEFAQDARARQNDSTYLLIIFFFSGTLIFIFLTTMITKSIQSSISELNKTMNKGIKEGTLVEASVYGSNEISEMADNYNKLINKLKTQIWITDGKNALRSAISDNMPIREFVDKALTTTARFLNAGSAVFYLFDEGEEILYLTGSYAFVERGNLSNAYKIGDGIIGQVAREQKPILLKGMRKEDGVIVSGTVSIEPFCAYAFPLVYNGKLLGVVEILFAKEIKQPVLEFMDEINRIITTNLNNNLQNDKIRTLLIDAQKAKIDLEQQAEELQTANIHLEEQQQALSQQSEELQQTNAQMEEQQQELEQMNILLEEQKEALVRQNFVLEEKNKQMDSINQDLDERSCELENANKYKSELLANMSHELRTPLNSIILLSRLLSTKEDAVYDEKEAEKVRVIHKSGVELLRLIDDILDLSKIEAGKMQVHENSFNTAGLVKEWVDMFKEIAADKQLVFDVVDNINDEIFSDRDKLSQIIRNFLSNAFKFTKSGIVEVKLDRTKDCDFPFKISVKDTGIGIPKAKQQIIFEAFSQANSSITREFGGTGLGLSICKELAKLLGAQIKLISEEGKGSEFIILIPDRESQVHKGNCNKKQMAIDNMQVNLPLDDRRNIQKGDKVILIIDDDLDFATVLMGIVRELGFKVLIALNGQIGLEMARKHMPMGVLLDLMLPDMSGTKLLSILKSEKELSNIPVHIISGMEQDLSLRKSGAIGFTAKPLSLENIKEALNQITHFSLNSVKHVLLVEDNEVHSTAIHELLGAENIQITVVSEEKEAVHKIENGSYDAVVVDLMIKNGSGLNLCRYIDENSKDIPVIVYTAKRLTFEQEHELKKYSDSIILKTASSHERLMDEVRMFLHKVRHDRNEKSSIKDKLLESHSKELKGKKILIVDDDSKNVFVLVAALEKLEVEVDNAHNGKEAIEKLKKDRFDLVLMDIMMPIMDGYEAIKIIKGDEAIKKIPIIALTAKALKGDKEKALEAGADDYISKPVDYDILVRLINAWISKGLEA